MASAALSNQCAKQYMQTSIIFIVSDQHDHLAEILHMLEVCNNLLNHILLVALVKYLPCWRGHQHHLVQSVSPGKVLVLVPVAVAVLVAKRSVSGTFRLMTT